MPPSQRAVVVAARTPFQLYEHERAPQQRILVAETERMVHVAQNFGEGGVGPMPMRYVRVVSRPGLGFIELSLLQRAKTSAGSLSHDLPSLLAHHPCSFRESFIPPRTLAPSSSALPPHPRSLLTRALSPESS